MDLWQMYRNPDEYEDYATHVDDIPFYVEEAKASGGSVLELACGTGRVTIPIAKAGVSITGLDVTPAMLERAREKEKTAGVQVEWIEADYRDYSLGRKFDLIIIPYHSIAHLHDCVSYERFFRCVSEHLASSGRFIVEVWNPGNPGYDLGDEVRPPEEELLTVNRIRHWFEGDRSGTINHLFLAEFKMLFEKYGFKLLEVYGDVNRVPYNPIVSGRIICIAGLKSSGPTTSKA